MLTTALRRAVALIVFGVAFVVNPLYVAGCVSSSEDNPERAAGARTKLLGMLDDLNGQASWSFEVDGEQYELLLELTQAERDAAAARAGTSATAFASVAHACGQHTFYQSASACDTSYALAVEGSFTLRQLGDEPETIASDVPLSGTLTDWGSLSLQTPDGGYLSLEQVDPDASFTVRSFTASGLGSDALELSFER